jgi:hypothetical protein
VRLRGFAAALSVLVLAPHELDAQSIVGRTVGSRGGEPIASAAVQLLDSTGAVHREVLSDKAGIFRVRAAAPGSYVLQATMLGYASVVSMPLRLEPASLLQVEVRMDLEVLTLDPVRVIAERTMRTGRLAEYFDRAERGARGAGSRIFTREDIEEGRYGELRHLLQTVNVRRGCSMTYFIDGLPATAREMDTIDPEWVEGIEIYASRTAVPVDYMNHVACAATFIWMRRDMPGRPISWPRLGPRQIVAGQRQ